MTEQGHHTLVEVVRDGEDPTLDLPEAGSNNYCWEIARSVCRVNGSVGKEYGVLGDLGSVDFEIVSI